MKNLLTHINQNIKHHKMVIKSLKTNGIRSADNECNIVAHKSKLDVYEELKTIVESGIKRNRMTCSIRLRHQD